MSKPVYAEDVKNYWKTSTQAPDTLIAKAKKEITARGIGGKVTGEGFVSTGVQAMYMLQFQIGEDLFRITWPVLVSRTKDETAAKRQAATFLYYDIKAKCMVVKVKGARKAFAPEFILPDGRTVSEVMDNASDQLSGAIAGLFEAPKNYIDGEVIRE